MLKYMPIHKNEGWSAIFADVSRKTLPAIENQLNEKVHINLSCMCDKSQNVSYSKSIKLVFLGWMKLG